MKSWQPGKSGSGYRLHRQRLGRNFGCHLGDGKVRELLVSQFLHLQNASNNNLYPVEAVKSLTGQHMKCPQDNAGPRG